MKNLLYLSIFFTFIVSHYAQNTTQYSPLTTSTSYQQTDFMTTPSLTVQDFVVTALEDAAGNQIELSNNVYTWNVTLIIKLINETNPDYLYDSDNIALVTAVLPDYVLKQLPVSLLLYHGLCEYINMTQPEYFECLSLNLTLAAIDFCVGPLIHSNIDSRTKETEINGSLLLTDCGISCRAGQDIYGLTDKEQQLIDITKIIGCSLCFAFLCFLALNQYMDTKQGKSLRKKPLLQHLPYFITLSLFIIVFGMTIGEIVGKENILCRNVDYEDYDEGKQFSSDNPIQGKDPVCTIDGIIFYSAILYWIGYLSLLSFVIFRSLYKPLKPLWNIPKKYWHLLVFCFVAIFLTLTIESSSYNGVWPMGVCFPGENVQEYVCIPLLICSIISGIFLTLSTFLLNKELKRQTKVTNIESTHSMRDLLKRIIIYSFSVEAVMILLTLTAFEFDLHAGDIMNEWIEISLCMTKEAIIDPLWTYSSSQCPSRKLTMNPFWFLSWTICCVCGVASQTVLSCHDKMKNRLRRVASAPIHMVSSVKKSTIDIIESKNQSMLSTTTTTTNSNKRKRNNFNRKSKPIPSTTNTGDLQLAAISSSSMHMVPVISPAISPAASFKNDMPSMDKVKSLSVDNNSNDDDDQLI